MKPLLAILARKGNLGQVRHDGDDQADVTIDSAANGRTPPQAAPVRCRACWIEHRAL